MLTSTRRGLLVGLLLLGCSKALGPTEPVWGKQACESCRMLVSDPFYAAQLVDERGHHHFFDDIGCMDAYLVDHAGLVPQAMWVHAGPRWVDARTARYASGAASPMAYGYVPKELGPLDFAAVRQGAAAHRRESSR